MGKWNVMCLLQTSSFILNTSWMMCRCHDNDTREFSWNGGGQSIICFLPNRGHEIMLKKEQQKKTMEKEIMFWIGINPMVRLIFKKKKDIAMWAQFVCSSWNIVIWLQHRLFGGWRSKTPCSRLGIALPCGCSTNRPGVRAKTTFNHHRNKETNAPNTHKAWFSKVQGQFYIMTKWLHQNKSGYLYQWLTHWYKSI